jgi:hypothetical protein
VVFAGDYNNPEDWVMPVRIIEEHVTPEAAPSAGQVSFAGRAPASGAPPSEADALCQLRNHLLAQARIGT